MSRPDRAPTPIRERLRVEPLTPERLDAMIARARAARPASSGSRAGPRALGWATAGVALGVAVAWLAGAFELRSSLPPDSLVPQGPLLTANGRPLPRLTATSAPASVALADGSQITARPGARLVPLESSPSRNVLLVERGRVDFQVRPGGPRRWIVEAGGVQVEVVGTIFSVERDDAAVRVDVTKGAVLVRSALLTDGVRRVEAGERLRVPRAREAPPLPTLRDGATARPPAAEVSRSVGAPRSTSGGPRATPTVEPQVEAAPPATKPARRETGAESSDASVLPLEPRARLAAIDRARREGRIDDAVRALRYLVEDEGAPMDLRAVAAFTLGRVAAEDLDAPGEAAEAFDRALELGLPAALEQIAVRRRDAARAGMGETSKTP